MRKKPKINKGYLQTAFKERSIKILYNSFEYVRAYKQPSVWIKFRFVNWLLAEFGAYNVFWLCKYKIEGFVSVEVGVMLNELTFNKAAFLKKEVLSLFEVKDLKYELNTFKWDAPLNFEKRLTNSRE